MRPRRKTRTTYAVAGGNNDGKPVVILRVGTETMVMDADELELFFDRLSEALRCARDLGGEL